MFPSFLLKQLCRLQLIAHHSNLVYLELSECYKVSNSIVAKLLTGTPILSSISYLLLQSNIFQGLPNLRHLNLEKCRRISDNGLTSLSSITSLLDILFLFISFAFDFSFLFILSIFLFFSNYTIGLTNLEFLDVSGTQISDKTVCEQISCIYPSASILFPPLLFPSAPLSSLLVYFLEVLITLSVLHSLTSLGLSGSGATDKAVAGLQSLTNLRYLAMGSSSIGNEACHLISGKNER